jgi:hypothetical protein
MFDAEAIHAQFPSNIQPNYHMGASKYEKILQVLSAAPDREAVYALKRGEYGAIRSCAGKTF